MALRRHTSGGLKARRARVRREKLREATRRRQRTGKGVHKIKALDRGAKRAFRRTHIAAQDRRRALDAAARRYERLGVVTALSSLEQQRKGTIPGGRRAARLRALQQALHRRMTVNPARKPKRRRKAKTMAKRSAAQRAAFKRMVAGLNRYRARRGVTVVANPRRRRSKRRRARSVVVMANPRRRRRRAHMRHNPRFRRRRHRRNPGMGAVVKGFVKVAVPSVLSGASFGLLDAKLLAGNNLSQPVRYAAKAAYALALGFLFRKNPILSASAMGGVLGSFGSDVAAQLGGGTPVAPTTVAAVKGIGSLLREDPQAMGLLVQQMNGMGYVVDNNVSLSRMRGMASVGVGDDTESYDDVNLG